LSARTRGTTGHPKAELYRAARFLRCGLSGDKTRTFNRPYF
jgi:hypothetical protein